VYKTDAKDVFLPLFPFETFEECREFDLATLTSSTQAVVDTANHPNRKDGALNKFIIVLDFVLQKCLNIACPKDVDLNNLYAIMVHMR